MTNVAFLTYQYDSNPKGLPSSWPSQVLEIGNSTTPPGANWQVLSLSDYNAYVASAKPAYDTWSASQPQPGLPMTQENFEVNTYNSMNILSSTTWYSTKTGTATYTGKCRDIVFTVSSNTITSAVEKKYDSNGNVIATKNYSYYTGSNPVQFITENS